MTSKVEPPGPEDAESDEFHEVDASDALEIHILQCFRGWK